MNYVFIRTFPKDDYITRLCYESFKAQGIAAKYIFFAEKGDYPLCEQTDGEFMFRKKVSNFGGQSGARTLLRGLKKMSKIMRPNDIIFVVDADVVLYGNPLEILKNHTDWQMSGIFSGDLTIRFVHISGQMIILTHEGVLQALKTYPCYMDPCVEKMISEGYGVADDNYVSYQIDDDKKVDMTEHKMWLHYKFYEYTGRLDFNNVLSEIRQKNGQYLI